MSLEVIGALLKGRPADFFVRENSLVSLAQEDQATFRYFLLRKCGFTTMEAITQIAKAAGIPAAAISYSGLKDEDAITEQLVALPIGANPSFILHGECASRHADRWLHLHHYGYGLSPLQIVHLAGNTFHVVMRALTETAAAALKLRRSINLVFLNYYDLQRFGFLGSRRLPTASV